MSNNKKQVTQWFGHAAKPLHIGRYPVKKKNSTRNVFRYWNGKFWQLNFFKRYEMPMEAGDKWRGLANNPAARSAGCGDDDYDWPA
jgi:hypothetical protein